MNIIPGIKSAKIASYETIVSSGGKPAIRVEFSFLEGGEEQRMSWFGWLSPAALDRTEKTLTDVLGWNGDDTFGPKALTVGTVAEIDVQNEEYNGTTSPKIKWVNSPGGSLFKKATPEVVRATGLKAAYLARRAGQPNKSSGDFAKDDQTPF